MVNMKEKTENSGETTKYKWTDGIPHGDMCQHTFICGISNLSCKRYAGHRGVHLSDETGQLIYWENN
jgi:hypothetical protein